MIAIYFYKVIVIPYHKSPPPFGHYIEYTVKTMSKERSKIKYYSTFFYLLSHKGIIMFFEYNFFIIFLFSY